MKPLALMFLLEGFILWVALNAKKTDSTSAAGVTTIRIENREYQVTKVGEKTWIVVIYQQGQELGRAKIAPQGLGLDVVEWQGTDAASEALKEDLIPLIAELLKANL